MAFTDRELLARLIQCEAGGEGVNGMLAVATAVMNRVRDTSGEYGRIGGGSLRSVIFQRGQFECALEGRAQSLYNMRPEQIHFDLADRALAGERLPEVGDALWFFNPYANTCPPNFPSGVGMIETRIGNHCFYSPTEKYSLT